MASPTTPFTYITLIAPYVLLKVQSSISLSEDVSDVASFAFGQLFQVAAGSTLTLGTNYCIQTNSAASIRTLRIENTLFYLMREDNLRFTETPPPAPM